MLEPLPAIDQTLSSMVLLHMSCLLLLKLPEVGM